MSEDLQRLISYKFNNEILRKILYKTSGNEDTTITNIVIDNNTTAKGDSYLSTIIKLKVEGIAEKSGNENKITCPLIIKVLPKNIARRISFRSTDFFKNEVIFYEQIWDTLLKFQESKNVQNKFTNLPKCLASLADGENDFIALEDLTFQDYFPKNRQAEIDYSSIIIIIRTFARFHALSFAFKAQNPEQFQKLVGCMEETYFAEKHRNWYAEFQKTAIACSRDAIENELPAEYLKKFDAFVNNDLYTQFISICNRKFDKLSVISHGDTWIPNFLFKYDEQNKPVDVKLIDFQLTRCCSPACDITFFLYTGTNYSILNERWDDIIQEYYSAFSNFLSEFGPNPITFTLDELKADIKTNALLGVGMSMEAIPFQMMDENDIPDLDSIQGDEGIQVANVWRVYPIKHKEGRQRLANVFKHAMDRGFI